MLLKDAIDESLELFLPFTIFWMKFLKNGFPLQPEVLEQLSGLKEFWMDGNRLTLIPGVSSFTVLNIRYFNLQWSLPCQQSYMLKLLCNFNVT